MMLSREASFERCYEAEFVDAPPAGSADHKFGSPKGTQSCVFVTVFPFDAKPWTGSFRAEISWRGVSGLFPTPDDHRFCLINRGRAFLVDARLPSDTQVIESDGPVRTVASIADPAVLLLATPWSVIAVDDRGEAWVSERISIESLRLDEAVGHNVIGVADPDDEAPRKFAIDLRTGTVDGGIPRP